MKDYKKILEGVVDIINTTEKSDIGFANICSYIGENCPELKESEDERIRKEILDCAKAMKADKWIAWLDKQGQTFTKKDVDDAYLKGICDAKHELEKQGEQKSIYDLTQQEAMDIAVDKCFEQGEQKPVVIPKFRIGDIIKDTEDGEVFTIRTITKDKYIYTDDSFDWIKDQDEYELVEQKPTDEEMKELLHTEYEKGRADAIEEMQNHTWSEDDERMKNQLVDFMLSGIDISKAPYGCVAWLKSLKGRIFPQPKQEWSEEDKENLDRIITIIHCYTGTVEEEIKLTNWLKSLIPQSTWKPSDEQMYILNWVADILLNHDSVVDVEASKRLQSLYNDLKKLREE